MAEGNFLKTMEEMLECRICLCLLDDPKGLQCQHSYCKDCLDDLLKFHPDGSATLSCVMKCEGVVNIEANKTTNELSAPYQLKGILEMYKMQNSTSPPNNSCRGGNECKKEAVMYCFTCYNLYCASCKCNDPSHLSSHTPVKYVEKYNQLMPICKIHDAIAKHICCRTEMICVYCRHRGHLNHTYENIEDQAKRVKELLSPNEEGDKGEIERLRENTKNNYEITKTTSGAIRSSLVKLLKNRTLSYGLQHMSVANSQAKHILSEFDILTANHLSSYPKTGTNDSLKDIDLGVNMELFVKKHFITNEYTKFLSMVPTLKIDVSDVRHSHPVGALDITTGASRAVSIPVCSSSVSGGLDRFNVADETSCLLTKLESIVQEVKDGDTSNSEASLSQLFECLSIDEDEVLGPPSGDVSVRPKVIPSAPMMRVAVKQESSSRQNVKQTITAMSSDDSIPLFIMNSWDGFPQTNGVGNMYVGNVNDDKFNANEIITWENTAGKAGPWQWLGWRDRIFATQTLRIRFWIKFVDRVPAQSENFGIKVYGTVFNEFVKRCERNKWCFVEHTTVCGSSGDRNHVILIFDSISHKQIVRISQLQVELLANHSPENVVESSSISCPICGVSDIPHTNSLLDHLVGVHNVILPVHTEGTAGGGVGGALGGGGNVNVAEPPRRVVVPKAGDRIIAMWGESRWQYFTACIRSFHANKAEYEIDWDDGDTTGRFVGVEHIALDRVPEDNELNIGTVVLFPQGMYHAGATQRTGGKRWHQGVITEIFTDMRGVRRYSGHHTKTDRDGKYCTYRGYLHEFIELTREDFRLAPNLFDVIQLPSHFKAKEHAHTLSLITNNPGVSWFCHQCVATKCALKHYGCATCQYDLCLECIKEDLKAEITRNSEIRV